MIFKMIEVFMLRIYKIFGGFYIVIFLILSVVLNIGFCIVLNNTNDVVDKYRALSNDLLDTNESLLNKYVDEINKDKEIIKDTKIKKYTANDKEFDLLCRLVECEAQGLSKDSKSYIVYVVLNRIESKDFPNNMTDVIYQENQFTPVSTGKIDRIDVTKDTVDVVANTLESNVDKTNGALYFGNMSYVSRSDYNWFHTLEYIFEKEGHTFFK